MFGALCLDGQAHTHRYNSVHSARSQHSLSQLMNGFFYSKWENRVGVCVLLPELVILTGVLTRKIRDSYYSHTSETTHRLSYGEEYYIIRCLKFNFGISHISDLLQRINIQYIFTSNYLFQILKSDPIWINNERIRFSSFGLLTRCEIH